MYCATRVISFPSKTCGSGVSIRHTAWEWLQAMWVIGVGARHAGIRCGNATPFRHWNRLHRTYLKTSRIASLPVSGSG
eukprot:3011800-Rhodomonas_salina.2